MSGLACILALRSKEVKAATWFGAAQVLMGRVGGSLLPSELMTHHETEAELQARMPAAVWREAFALGTQAPDVVVEQALVDTAPSSQRPGIAGAPPRLTRTQLSIVQDLVQGYDIPRLPAARAQPARKMSWPTGSSKVGLTTATILPPCHQIGARRCTGRPSRFCSAEIIGETRKIRRKYWSIGLVLSLPLVHHIPSSINRIVARRRTHRSSFRAPAVWRDALMPRNSSSVPSVAARGNPSNPLFDSTDSIRPTTVFWNPASSRSPFPHRTAARQSPRCPPACSCPCPPRGPIPGLTICPGSAESHLPPRCSGPGGREIEQAPIGGSPMSDIISPDGDGSKPNLVPRLTPASSRSCTSWPRDTNRHGRRPARPRISSTYELAGRVCGRLGLSQWEEIGPYAIEHGLMDGLDGDSR